MQLPTISSGCYLQHRLLTRFLNALFFSSLSFLSLPSRSALKSNCFSTYNRSIIKSIQSFEVSVCSIMFLFNSITCDPQNGIGQLVRITLVLFSLLTMTFSLEASLIFLTAFCLWNPICPTSIPLVLCKLSHIVYTLGDVKDKSGVHNSTHHINIIHLVSLDTVCLNQLSGIFNDCLRHLMIAQFYWKRGSYRN